MLKNKDIIVFGSDWDDFPTSKHQIFKIFSKYNKVLWINSIGIRNFKLKRKDILKAYKRIKFYLTNNIKKINKNLIVLQPIYVPFKIKCLDKLNNFVLGRQIKDVMNNLKFQEPIIWSFLPIDINFLDLFSYNKLVYHITDDYSLFPGINKQNLRKKERVIIKKADLIFVTSDRLYKLNKRFNKNIYKLDHGVDYKHFSKALKKNTKIPYDTKFIKKPIVGFFGLIDEWIDLNLIKKVAKSFPKISVVLIGKTNINLDSLKQYKNIYCLGPKAYSILPNYCKSFDIAIIPFKINNLTKSVNPIKLYEYLIAGLPVVSTALPTIMSYRKYIYISKNDKEFIKNIFKLLVDRNRKPIFDRYLSWNCLTRKISNILQKSLI